MSTVLEGAPAAGASAKARNAEFVLTLACPERPGIVRAITTFLADRGFDIVEHQQFDDHVSGKLYLRTAFGFDKLNQRDQQTAESLSSEFAATAGEFGMDFSVHDGRPQRLLVMVSKFGHCLNDLIFRWRAGSLGAEIAVVVSNHEDLRPMAEAAGLPFIHIPVSSENKADAERQLLDLVDEYNIDLVEVTAQGVGVDTVGHDEVDPHEEPPDELVPELLALDDVGAVLDEVAADGVDDPRTVGAGQGQDEVAHAASDQCCA